MTIIFLKDIVDENFARFIPKFIVKQIVDKVRENKYVAMQQYLQDKYQLSIEDIVNQLFLQGFSYSKVKNYILIRINDNIKEFKSQEKLSTLIRLIDYGNLEVRGINLINSSIQYTKINILNIYRVYQMRGEQ